MTPYLLALAGGLLTALSQPKVSWFFLAFFGPSLVLEAVARAPKRAFSLPFLAGLVYFFALLYWLVPVMHHFGGLPLPAALGALGLLSAYLALYWAVPFWLFVAGNFLRGKPSSCLLWAAYLTAFEYLRAKVPLAFPWGLLGSALYQALPLIQVADLGGVFAVSFLLYLSNYALFSLARHRKKGPLLLALLLLLSAWGYGTVRLKTPFSGPSQRIGLIQGNIPQDVKWDQRFLLKTLLKYEALSSEALACEARLLVWPETALPAYATPENPLFQEILAFTARKKLALIFGAPRLEEKGGRLLAHNSLFLAVRGKIKGIYDKQRLVPFGEFVPLEDKFPWLRTFAVASGDYTPGPKASPLKLEAGKVFGPLICFESIFPDLARREVLKGATILLVATNDAWFGTTAGPYQHFVQAIFRAVETRRYVVRVANTGISGLIDPHGRVLLKTPLEREAAPCVTAKHLAYFSWYTRKGDLFALFCLLLTALASVSSGLRRRKDEEAPSGDKARGEGPRP